MMKLLIIAAILVTGTLASSISLFSKAVQDAKSADGKTWAVLVAGSNGFENYRHQADICHAYQILKGHGIPDEQIIVMMYDDIADNKYNPSPGVLINRPGGRNVYVDVPKDYIGGDVSPDNFLKVLEGDKQLKLSGKKVLESTSSDNVFIYFADHGAPGLIAFPSDELYARELIETLNQLHEKNAYSKMLIYIEACESGSMFEGLLEEGKRILGVTAANSRESSYGYYCETDLDTCLGDEFSVKWMEDTDRHADLNKYTVADQFKTVKKATELSHVMRYGDLSISELPLADFQGSRVPEQDAPAAITTSKSTPDRILSYDIPLVMAERRAKVPGPEQGVHQKILQEIREGRQLLENVTRGLAKEFERKFSLTSSLLGQKMKLRRHDCYQQLVQSYKQNCFNLSKHPHALRSLFLFANVCESVYGSNADNIEQLTGTIASYCATQIEAHPFHSII